MPIQPASIMFRIAYAAFARGTHHKLAMDALNRLAGADRQGWQRLFLANAEVYATGAKLPDDKFKDFKNHVLHPRDNYWGGAVEASRQWYGTLVEHLKAQRWTEAVSAAGVLSHYLSDPLHPFHTAQSEAENCIHRACEWSINRSYDALYADGTATHPDYIRRLARDPNWLARLVCESADISNAQYEKLIAHYDITRGVSDPPSGLDVVARRLCGELLVTAAATIAAVLDHAFEEAGVKPPVVSLTVATLLAAIKIPQSQLLKRFENTADRKQVQAIYDELRATGTVVKQLPEENLTIRNLYAAEVIAARPKVDIAKAFPPPADGTAYVLPVAKVEPKIEAPPRKLNTAELAGPDVVTPVTQPANANLTSVGAKPAGKLLLPPADRVTSAPRTYLTRDADVVDAPSIGPKMADRLFEHGVKTVADLLAANPEELAAKLGQRQLDAATVKDWQDQTTLVLDVPGLRGGHAQLLVGAGYRTREAVAAAEVPKLCADVLAYAVSNEGRRVLRDGTPPEADRIATWHANAQGQKAA